jgi:methionyl-tRNA formyltransferase
MRIIFIGTIEFSSQILQFLLSNKVNIVGVITSNNNKINSDYADLTPICINRKIPYILVDDINKENVVDWMDELKSDLIFCFGWSRLIKSDILKLPTVGVVGFHPAELPYNRGRHPLIWAIVLGLKKTASTYYLMDEGVDSGDIISQREIIISVNENAQSLYNKVIDIAKDQILELLPLLYSGKYKKIIHNKTRYNTWRKRNINDGEIDWRMCARHIHGLIRGLTHPYIGAHFISNGGKHKVWTSEIVNCKGFENIEPGKVIIVDNDSITVKCADSCVKLIDVTPKLSLLIGDYI